MEKMQKVQSADIVSDKTGRQYHINLAPGELAEYIIMCGESKRAERASKLLDNVRVFQQHREYYTYTGSYKGTEVSIMSTGIGPACTEIAMVEIFQITKNPAFIRVGTCGALREDINLGDIIISSGAVRLEDTSTYFVHEGYPAIANHEVILSLIKSAERELMPYHVGITASSSGFYGAQGRDIPGVKLRNSELPEQMAEMNVLNFEMETSALFNLANFLGLRASAACMAIINRPLGTFIDLELRERNELKTIIVGLEAMRVLEKMDQKKLAAGKKYWVPDEI